MKNFIENFINYLDRSTTKFNILSKYSTKQLLYRGNIPGIRKYSTVVNNNNLETNLTEFYQWFVGFSDGESSFQIQIKYSDQDKTKIRGVNFSFTISLHIDDIAVLKFIKDKLEIGNITVKKTRAACVFSVTNQEGLNKLISIFDKYNLNTTKYLDYLDFRKAFLLYQDKDINFNKENLNILINQIVDLKSRMNSERTFFDMSVCNTSFSTNSLHSGINKNWLLGFIEAEGSFFISITDIEPSFSIELSNAQMFLLEKIKDFLISDLGFDGYSLFQLKSSSFSVISVNKQKVKPSAILLIKNIRVLNNYLVPYLSTEVFKSKKGQDFEDWKLICEAVYKGSHKIDEIRELILRLTYSMNNYRLSTNLNEGSIELLTRKERSIIQDAPAYLEHLEDGRLREVKTGKVFINKIPMCIWSN
uniref:Putative maturase n=1 Tax=Cryphonectria parasitica TaxID=5116 RepID=O20958_CRYPA|nr:putative maturase [Cryphonectria parasitica]